MRVALRRAFTWRTSPQRSFPVVSATKGKKKRKRMARMDFSQGLNIAVEGCCHGELDKIYATLRRMEETEGLKIDLLICCGDFQAVRNLEDLECMAVPQKYKNMMTYYKYYDGSKRAPFPTLFIGGNHEAINHLRELYYGGWVAPDIYYLGYSGVVRFGGVRIAGISGIYNTRHYDMGYYEALPYNDGTKRSAYHTRIFDVFKLKQIKEDVDVFLSHDWPDSVTDWGNSEQLIQKKPFFRKEIQERSLGSPAGTELLNALQPKYYFAAHLHVKYPALVDHGNGKETRFLALDKCLPRRDFLQIVNIPFARGPRKFSYDREWLGILKCTMPLMSFGPQQPALPFHLSLEAAKKDASEKIVERIGDLAIPRNFEMSAECYTGNEGRSRGRVPRHDVRNPQTEAFLELLDVPYNLHYGNKRHEIRIGHELDAELGVDKEDFDASLITFE